MQTINCYIPLKLRLRGELREDDWNALEEVLVAKYTSMLKRSVAELTKSQFIHAIIQEHVQELFEDRQTEQTGLKAESGFAAEGQSSTEVSTPSDTEQTALVQQAPTSNILGLSIEKQAQVVTAIEDLLETAIQKSGHQAKQERKTLSMPVQKRKEWVSVDVPIDKSLLDLKTQKELDQELTVRLFLVAFKLNDIILERLMAERIYERIGWTVTRPFEEIHAEIASRLKKQSNVIPYHTDRKSLFRALKLYHTILTESVERLRRAEEELHKSHYAEDAILSFYIAHVNAVIDFINGIVDLPVAPYNLYQKIRGEGEQAEFHLGRIPKIPYIGEYGKAYGEILELGATLGLFFLPLKGASSLLTETAEASLPWLARLVSGVKLRGASIGPTLLKVIHIMIAGGSLSYTGIAAYDIGAALAALKSGKLVQKDGTLRDLREEDIPVLIEQIIMSVFVVHGALKSGLLVESSSRERPPTRKPAKEKAPSVKVDEPAIPQLETTAGTGQQDTPPTPTLHQRQRAAALRSQAAALETEAIAEEQKAATAASTNPSRAERLWRRAIQLRDDATSKRAEAEKYASGSHSATEDLPGPEEIDQMFEQASTEGKLISIPFHDIEHNPSLLVHTARKLMSSRSGQRVVYRVEGGGSRTLVDIDANGNVTVARGKTIHLNFGSEERAKEFLLKRESGARIVAFEVDEEWFRSLRSAAIPEHKTKAFKGKQPRLVDITKAEDQLEIPGKLTPELQDFIIPRTGRVLEIK